MNRHYIFNHIYKREIEAVSFNFRMKRMSYFLPKYTIIKRQSIPSDRITQIGVTATCSQYVPQTTLRINLQPPY